MKSPPLLAFIVLTLSLLLGGCWNMHASDPYVPVQDYTGQGYRLMNGDQMDKIAEAHRKEIIDATKTFFLDQYKTKVNVHNIVGNKDGATVFVESIGEPHFHTYAIVPIDARNDYIMKNEIWSQEGQVEQAIRSGLYHMLNKKKFDNLDAYLENIVKKYPVTGKTMEAINKTSSSKYITPYYYVTNTTDILTDVYAAYIKDQNLSKKELQKLYKEEKINPKYIDIVIQLFMKKKDAPPDKSLFKKLCHDIEQATDFPEGIYSIYINDNRMLKEDGTGVKDNSLEKSDPDPIIKN